MQKLFLILGGFLLSACGGGNFLGSVEEENPISGPTSIVLPNNPGFFGQTAAKAQSEHFILEVQEGGEVLLSPNFHAESK